MGCLKLTYQTTEPQLKVVHRRHSHEKKCVQWFLSIDPLADKYTNISPYNYALNNPLSFIDPDGRAPNPILLKVVQQAIQNVPASRAIQRISSAHYKVFGKSLASSNPVLANIPLKSEFVHEEGSLNALLGSNEIKFSGSFNAFGRDFDANVYYQRKSKGGLFSIDGINVHKGANSRESTNAFGNAGYFVSLDKGPITVILLSLPDAQTHEIFENLLNDATGKFVDELVAENSRIGDLLELAELSDEVTKMYLSFDRENPFDANSKEGKKYLSLLKNYTDKRNRYQNESNEDLWEWIYEKTKNQLDR